MALRNQPYIPLYVQDYLTDEKLNECSAQTQGVYIKIMCIMHKSDEYGCILLLQKDKQNESTVKNFALKLSRHLTFDKDMIESSLSELIFNNVLSLDGDKLFQKRMVRDNDISEKRALAGQKGGKFAIAKTKAKSKQNPEYENEIENENINENKDQKEKKKKYGEYKHVLLTDSQREKLISEHGQEVAELAIKILDEGIEAKGYKYKNHYLVILKWPLENAKKQLLKNNELTLDQIFEDAREETRRRSEGKI